MSKPNTTTVQVTQEAKRLLEELGEMEARRFAYSKTLRVGPRSRPAKRKESEFYWSVYQVLSYKPAPVSNEECLREMQSDLEDDIYEEQVETWDRVNRMGR